MKVPRGLILSSLARDLGEAQSKATRAYAQSGQYHTIVESRVRLTSITCHILRVRTFSIFFLY